jgi:dolichyl-phosphate beta-glucosyltransferase
MSRPPSVARVTLVVPCYNEAARLELPAFARMLDALPTTDLVFVDDGSTDATAAVVSTFAEAHPGRASLLRLPANRGKAEAVREGLLHALGGRPQYVGFWDADLATPLDALPEFIAVLDDAPRCEWVIGARVRLLGRRIERRPARHYAGRLFATAASKVLNLPVYDTQCGAKLFRATSTLQSCLTTPFRSRWIFDVELLARYRDATGADATTIDDLVYELPLREWRDVHGSKVTSGAFLRAAVELYGIYRSRPELAPRPAAAPVREPS